MFAIFQDGMSGEQRYFMSRPDEHAFCLDVVDAKTIIELLTRGNQYIASDSTGRHIDDKLGD